MTDTEAVARRIRDAFERDLAEYHAPADLAERARAGGLRRARKRRIQLAASMAAATCAAVVTGLVIVPLTGTAPSGGGGVAPVTISPPAVSPLPSLGRSPESRAGLPPAASVGKAMLTAFNAATGDIVYERQLG